MKKYLGEFVGTLVFMFLTFATIASTKHGSLISVALAFGVSYTVIYVVLNKITGCHLNPAISFACWVNKRISFIQFVFYTVFQILGAIVAAILVWLVCCQAPNDGYDLLMLICSTELSSGWFSPTSTCIVIIEVIGSIALVFTYLLFSKKMKSQNAAAVAIGAVYFVVICMFGGLNGASYNPAKAIASALVYGTIYNMLFIIVESLLFIVCSFIGALFAALLYSFADKRGMLDWAKNLIPGNKNNNASNVDLEFNTDDNLFSN